MFPGPKARQQSGKNELFHSLQETKWFPVIFGNKIKTPKVLGTIFKVFFGSFTSPSSWHLAIFSQQKTGPGVMPLPSGEIEKVAGGLGGGGGYQPPQSFRISLRWLIYIVNSVDKTEEGRRVENFLLFLLELANRKWSNCM